MGLLILVAALLAGATRPWVEFGPQQAVVSSQPKLGVHTRLTDEVEPWKVQRTLQLVREMGASWVVEYFLWAAHEPSPGVYDWSHADLVVDHARNQGLKVIGRLGYVPDWARPPDTSHLYLDQKGYGAYADFVGAFVRHFKGRIDHLIVWNEPNLSQEWGFRQVDPVGYTELLRQAYEAAKREDPEIQVLCCALAPTLAAEGSQAGMDDLVFLQRMYDAGAAPYFDGLAAHAYGWTFPPGAEPDPRAVNFRRVELLREIMVRNGDGDKPVYITEAGWNDHPRWTKAVRPSQRVSNSLDAADLVEDWDWVEALALWAFRYPRPTGTYQDYYTLMGPNFEPKPIYRALQQLTGSQSSGTQSR